MLAILKAEQGGMTVGHGVQPPKSSSNNRRTSKLAMLNGTTSMHRKLLLNIAKAKKF